MFWKYCWKVTELVQNMLSQHPWIGEQWGGGEWNKRVWFLYWPAHEEHGKRLHIFVISILWQFVRFCGPDKEQVFLQIQRGKDYVKVKRKTTIVYIQLHKAYWRIKGSGSKSMSDWALRSGLFKWIIYSVTKKIGVLLLWIPFHWIHKKMMKASSLIKNMHFFPKKCVENI